MGGESDSAANNMEQGEGMCQHWLDDNGLLEWTGAARTARIMHARVRDRWAMHWQLVERDSSTKYTAHATVGCCADG